MLTFWIIAALLVLFVLWFVIPTLLDKPNEADEVQRREANVLVYKDQFRELENDLKTGLLSEDQYNQEKAGLERRLLEDVTATAENSSAAAALNNKFAYSVAAFIPLGAVIFYLAIGNPKGIDPATAPPTRTTEAQPAPASNPMSEQQQIAANIEKLAERLKQNPSDVTGWRMIARSYMMQDRFSDAAAAYEQLTKLEAKNADAWADYAEALGMANNRSLVGKPLEAINRALQIDPKHQRALDLAGTAAYQAGDYKKAISYWEKLLKLLPAGSEDLKAITNQITKAKELAAGKS
jgi:cytochrome c-type biogenesis protein CcmH